MKFLNNYINKSLSLILALILFLNTGLSANKNLCSFAQSPYSAINEPTYNATDTLEDNNSGGFTSYVSYGLYIYLGINVLKALLGEIPHLIKSVSYFFRRGASSLYNNGISNNPYKIMKELQLNLSNIKGQQKPKEELIDVALGTVYKSPLKDYKSGCRVILLNGGPGVGKTMGARAMGKSVTLGGEPFEFDASSIDSDDPRSVPAQMIQPVNTLTKNYKERSELVDYLETHSNPVIIFNEVDKIPENKLKSFFEMVRSIHDDGSIKGDGRILHLKDGLLILTGNIDPSCLDLNNTNPTKKHNENLFLKKISIDPALLTRIKVIEFDSLEENDIKDLVEQSFEEVKARFKKEFDIKIDFSEISTQVIQKVLNLNKGARGVSDIFYKIQTALLKQCILNYSKNKQRNSSFVVKIEKDEFVIKHN